MVGLTCLAWLSSPSSSSSEDEDEEEQEDEESEDEEDEADEEVLDFCGSGIFSYNFKNNCLAVHCWSRKQTVLLWSVLTMIFLGRPLGRLRLLSIRSSFSCSLMGKIFCIERIKRAASDATFGNL